MEVAWKQIQKNFKNPHRTLGHTNDYLLTELTRVPTLSRIWKLMLSQQQLAAKFYLGLAVFTSTSHLRLQKKIHIPILVPLDFVLWFIT